MPFRPIATSTNLTLRFSCVSPSPLHSALPVASGFHCLPGLSRHLLGFQPAKADPVPPIHVRPTLICDSCAWPQYRVPLNSAISSVFLNRLPRPFHFGPNIRRMIIFRSNIINLFYIRLGKRPRSTAAF